MYGVGGDYGCPIGMQTKLHVTMLAPFINIICLIFVQSCAIFINLHKNVRWPKIIFNNI